MCVLQQDQVSDRWPTTAGPWSTTTPFDPVASTGDEPLTEIVERSGTPAYVVDEADLRGRCRAFDAALPEAEIG